ncbi:hypothetical protein [Novosphingobium sp. FSW06-99]|uniref:hypothetical protein n=1 Tax=Novosphingobium sp. FSW06-99 TaxID=1739113 RepID=UPI000B1AB805|nr:hypothetical protein [Novosphingobium sp. FSW06-99]
MTQMISLTDHGEPAFSHVEHVILDIAGRESRDLQRRQGLLPRVSDFFLGRPDPMPLANEKLEALRQYAMRLYRYGVDKVPAATTAALNAAGYDAQQIALLHAAFTTLRHQPFGFGRKDSVQ